MGRNLKFLHSWHVYDVENVFKCVHVMLFCWKIGFVVIYAVCREICFDAIYALLCGEKLNQRLRMWRKNDKYEVWASERKCWCMIFKKYIKSIQLNTLILFSVWLCGGKWKKWLMYHIQEIYKQHSIEYIDIIQFMTFWGQVKESADVSYTRNI